MNLGVKLNRKEVNNTVSGLVSEKVHSTDNN